MKRRDFFKSITGVAAVLGLPKILTGIDNPVEKEITQPQTEIILQNKGSEKTDLCNKVHLFDNNGIICKGSNVKSVYNTYTDHIKKDMLNVVEYIPTNTNIQLNIKGDVEFIDYEKISACFNKLITYRFYNENGMIICDGVGHLNIYNFSFENEFSVELSVYKYQFYTLTNKID